MTDAKKYLQQIRFIKTAIKQKQRELEELHDTLNGIRAVDYEDDKVSSSRKNTDAGFVNGVLRMEELEKKIKAEMVQLTEKKHEIVCSILCMENEAYSKVLMMRYLDMMEFEDIAHTIGYSYQYVINIHRKALTAFGECLLKCKDMRTELKGSA